MAGGCRCVQLCAPSGHKGFLQRYVEVDDDLHIVLVVGVQKHHHHLRHGNVVGSEHVAVAVHLLADAQQLGAAQLRNAFPVAQDEVTGRRQPNDVTRASQQQSHAENPPLHTMRPPRRVPPAEIDEISPLSSTSDCCRWRPAIEVVVDSSVKGGALVRRITPSAEKLLGRALPQTGQPARHDLGIEGALRRCQRSNRHHQS